MWTKSVFSGAWQSTQAFAASDEVEGDLLRMTLELNNKGKGESELFPVIPANALVADCLL